MRKNIASVKVVKLPEGWATSDSTSDFGNVSSLPQGFTVIENDRFIELVNANPGLTGRPRIGHIIDNRLIVYPVPTIDEAGEELELLVYLKSATTTIDYNRATDNETEPELPEVFDKLLEYFATSQFLSGRDRAQWLSDYNNELKRLKPIEHRKHHNLERPPIAGWN